MSPHVRAYLRRVVLSWWNLIGAAGVAIAVLNGTTGADVPRAIWISLLVVGLLLAQFQAFRASLVEATHDHPAPPEVSSAEEGDGVSAAGTDRIPFADALPGRSWRSSGASLADALEVLEPVEIQEASRGRAVPGLDPLLLQGRIYPYMYAPAVESTETALAVRSALAARVATDPEPIFGSAEQQAFEDAIADSLLESWVLDQTSPAGRPSPDHYWRRVQPTRSNIVSLRRPPARTIVRGWTLEARAAISLRPVISVGPPGWLILNLDAVYKPASEADERSRPLSLEDFYGLLYVLMTALLDDVAPRALPTMLGVADYELLSVGAVASLSGTTDFDSFVGMRTRGWSRAEGSYDPMGLEQYLDSYTAIEEPERRADAIRRWLVRWLADAGYSGHEQQVEAMRLPNLPRR